MPPARKPWPMWWVIVAIVVFVGGYTLVNLKFRKPTKPSEPYQDAKDRFVNSRVEAAGYKALAVQTERPAEPNKARAAIAGTAATVKEALGGLTPELAAAFVDAPRLPEQIIEVKAAERATAALPYTFVFTCRMPDHQGIVGETRCYVKEAQVDVVSNLERLGGTLLARTQEIPVQVTIPAGTLSSGKTYQFTIVGKQGSKRWSVQVH